MKVDLHVHTCYSHDSNSSLEHIINKCLKSGMDSLAITDHNTIEGALRMREIAPFPVIIGEEVMSLEGEIIGYFLTEKIPKALSPEEVIDYIKAQGGLVCLPHPFFRFGRYPLKASKREELFSQIDIIEAFNSSSFFLRYSERAQAFADEHGLLKSAGSDAHSPRDVGKAFVEMPPFNGPEEFKTALSTGKIFGKRNSLYLLTTLSTLPKRLRNI